MIQVFYGGDGYFDNMNKYFGNNGYNIIDRNRNAFARKTILRQELQSMIEILLSKTHGGYVTRIFTMR
jgi:phosphoglycerol transferase MdoB-like AlkP superfamily enzyme